MHFNAALTRLLIQATNWLQRATII